MTGNNKFWRASLAGLASVAMLATMGVSAANAVAPSNEVKNGDSLSTVTSKVKAATYTVKVYDANEPYTVIGSISGTDAQYGDIVKLSDVADKAGKVFDYASYDQAGEQKVPSEFVVTGDVKLYAHYKDAVTVKFDADGNNAYDPGEPFVKIAKGTALTAEEYQDAFASNVTTSADGHKYVNEPAAISHPSTEANEFAGWTLTKTADFSSDDLYTGQTLNEDTVLYQRWDKGNISGANTGKNLANVSFHAAGGSDFLKLITVSGKAFPAFRAPIANGTWKQTLEGAAYDFSTPVVNKDGVLDASKPDLELVDAFAKNAQTVTVKFDSHTALYTPGDVATTSDQKIAEPTAPVRAGAVFLGWYKTSPWKADGSFDATAEKYDFSKTIAENFTNPGNTITLHAGWDVTNVAAFAFNVNYNDWADAQQVWFVNPGTTYDLPKLWDYYQTKAQENALKGEFTSASVTGWKWGKDVVTKATANTEVTVFTANWDKALSLKLDANGGKFGSDTVKWVTKAPSQKLADVVVTPTRDGYSFVQWRNLNKVGSYVEGKLFANLSDGYWYDISTKKQTSEKISEGQALKAEWKQSSVIDIAGYRNHFSIRYGAANRTQDIKTVADKGYTEDSAAKYVDAVNALEDEYKAWESEKDAQAKIDKANALAPKYEAAEALLVKSDVTVKPTPAEKVAVYRLYNPGLPQVAQHLYTSNVAEYNNLVTNHGWKGEGIVFYTTSDKTAKTVWRVYNPFTSEHFLTSDKAEYEDLYQNKGWSDDGPAWYIPADGDADVYRLRNAATGEHLYTVNAAEKDNLVDNAGWTLEGVQYKVYAK